MSTGRFPMRQATKRHKPMGHITKSKCLQCCMVNSLQQLSQAVWARMCRPKVPLQPLESVCAPPAAKVATYHVQNGRRAALQGPQMRWCCPSPGPWAQQRLPRSTQPSATALLL